MKGEYSFWMDGEKWNQSMGEPKEESIWCKEFQGSTKMRGTKGHSHGLDAQENKQGLEDVI